MLQQFIPQYPWVIEQFNLVRVALGCIIAVLIGVCVCIVLNATGIFVLQHKAEQVAASVELIKCSMPNWKK